MANPFEQVPGNKQAWKNCPMCGGDGKDSGGGKCGRCKGSGKVPDP